MLGDSTGHIVLHREWSNLMILTKWFRDKPLSGAMFGIWAMVFTVHKFFNRTYMVLYSLHGTILLPTQTGDAVLTSPEHGVLQVSFKLKVAQIYYEFLD